MHAEQLTPVITAHGEGAGWHPHDEVFKVVDLLAGDLVTVGAQGTVERRHVGTVAAAWRPTRTGGTVVATERGFTSLEHGWSVEAWRDPDFRMNDGGCDPQGRFFCGSMAYDARHGAGVLWRLDPDRTVTAVLAGMTIPNGLVFSRDGASAFHVDTPTGRIDRYDVDADAGTLHGRHPIVEIVGGAPDGMTLDAEGGLWVALWGGSAVHRYQQDGTLTEVVEVGARQVTSCAFGGDVLDQLLITTSNLDLPADSDPCAGAVFLVEPGVRGLPPLEYAG